MTTDTVANQSTTDDEVVILYEDLKDEQRRIPSTTSTGGILLPTKDHKDHDEETEGRRRLHDPPPFARSSPTCVVAGPMTYSSHYGSPTTSTSNSMTTTTTTTILELPPAVPFEEDVGAPRTTTINTRPFVATTNISKTTFTTQEPLPSSLSSSSSSSMWDSSSTFHHKEDDEEMMMVGDVDEKNSHSSSGDSSSCWIIPASQKSIRTLNPIRAIVDRIIMSSSSTSTTAAGTNEMMTYNKKDRITLALGDPTVSGQMLPYPKAIQDMIQTMQTTGHHSWAGYIPACGTNEARDAIAKYHSFYPQEQPQEKAEEDLYCSISTDDVIIANGCSGALEIALTALLDPGTILLVPQPGFPLYQVIAESHGASVLFYRLDPHRQWEIDMDYLEEILSNHPPSSAGRIRGIVINNPSNPTGAVYSEIHLRQIINLCHSYRIPIVADEVYGDLVFRGTSEESDNSNNSSDTIMGQLFHPMALVAARAGRTVPVITVSGLAKQFLLPGWRVGWICFHDNTQGSLGQVQDGAKRLAQIILGASHLAQSIVPSMLIRDDPDMNEWKQRLRTDLEDQAMVLSSRLSSIQGLEVIPPQGAMYIMVRILVEEFDLSNDEEFASQLLREENVFVLPGSAFQMSNYIRLVFCSDKATLEEASDRITEFCNRHRRQ